MTHGAAERLQSGNKPTLTVAPERSRNAFGELKHTRTFEGLSAGFFGIVIVTLFVLEPVTSNVTTADVSV